MGDPRAGEQLTHAELARRREAYRRKQVESVQRVDTLVQTQQSLGRDLGAGLEQLKVQSTEMRKIEEARADGSLLATLVRPFTARRAGLARRSVAEELLKIYERTSLRLREATAFADDLKLCAIELQQEVDRLHRDRVEAHRGERDAAGKVVASEAALQEIEAAALDPEERERRRDRFTFDLRTEAVNLELCRTAAEQAALHLEPARALRDTVLQLHEDMAKYVIQATHTVNAAGRRIQGLGVMADAPVVVQELQTSLDELSLAMEATSRYLAHSQRLVQDVLPELSARLDAHGEVENLSLTDALEGVDRARAVGLAERALREAAEREIDELGKR